MINIVVLQVPYIVTQFSLVSFTINIKRRFMVAISGFKSSVAESNIGFVSVVVVSGNSGLVDNARLKALVVEGTVILVSTVTSSGMAKKWLILKN